MESVKQFELLCDETFLYSKEIRLHYFVCVGIQKAGSWENHKNLSFHN